MKNYIFGFIIFLIATVFWQCINNNVPTTVDDVDLYIQSMDGTPLSGASVKVNEDTPVLTDSSGDAGDFTLASGDSISFSATGFKPVIVYLEDPILLSGLTVHLESSAPEIGTVAGKIHFDGVPCGINRVVNLDNPKQSTTCNSSGEYSLPISNPNPFRIGYVSDDNEVLKLKIKTSTGAAQLDVAMEDVSMETK